MQSFSYHAHTKASFKAIVEPRKLRYGQICNKCGNNARLTKNKRSCPRPEGPLADQACRSYITLGGKQ